MTARNPASLWWRTGSAGRSWRSGLLGLLLPAVLLAPAPRCAAADAPPADAAILATPIPLSGAAAIDGQLAGMHTRERAVEGVSPEGASATAYLSKAHGLEKIEVTALGERGRDRYDFYWRGKQLLAARARHIDYGAMITAIPTDQPLPMTLTQDDAIEYRRQKILRWLRDGQLQAVNGQEGGELAGDLAAKARSFRRLMQTPGADASGSCQWQCAGDWAGECRKFACR